MCMVTVDDVRKVAKIARLGLTADEEKKFTTDFTDILQAFSSLNKAPTSGVAPAFQPLEAKNVLREDKIEASLSQEEALANSKNTEKGYFKGPKVV